VRFGSIEEEGCQLVGFDGGKNDMFGRKRRLDLVKAGEEDVEDLEQWASQTFSNSRTICRPRRSVSWRNTNSRRVCHHDGTILM